MAKRAKKASAGISNDPFPVTSHRAPVDPGPAHAVPDPLGETTGYRDGDGIVERKIFKDGKLGKGWKDTPAGLKNNYRDGMVLIQ